MSEAFDGKPALWRRNLTLHAKYLTVMKVERQMMTLMGRLIREYVTDHELTVTLFDRCRPSLHANARRPLFVTTL